jgi:hypothetical protein
MVNLGEAIAAQLVSIQKELDERLTVSLDERDHVAIYTALCKTAMEIIKIVRIETQAQAIEQGINLEDLVIDKPYDLWADRYGIAPH